MTNRTLVILENSSVALHLENPYDGKHPIVAQNKDERHD